MLDTLKHKLEQHAGPIWTLTIECRPDLYVVKVTIGPKIIIAGQGSTLDGAERQVADKLELWIADNLDDESDLEALLQASLILWGKKKIL